MKEEFIGFAHIQSGLSVFGSLEKSLLELIHNMKLKSLLEFIPTVFGRNVSCYAMCLWFLLLIQSTVSRRLRQIYSIQTVCATLQHDTVYWQYIENPPDVGRSQSEAGLDAYTNKKTVHNDRLHGEVVEQAPCWVLLVHSYNS
jgi:hypothetical protein